MTTVTTRESTVHKKGSRTQKTIIHAVRVYYNKKIKIKISKTERHMGQGPGIPTQGFPLSSPLGVMQTELISPTFTIPHLSFWALEPNLANNVFH